MRLRPPHRRSGFTLVELIVAAGLTILIMTVLATGFQVGLQSLSQLKSAGDLADRLRTAETMLRLDLDAPHFESGSNPGTKKLSDFRFDLPGTLDASPPAGGFFSIVQNNPSSQEGIDQDSLSSTRNTTCVLGMTVQRTGKTAGELFSAIDPNVATILAQPANQMDVAVTPNTYVSDWAEVYWFLDTSRVSVQNGVNTYPLVRRVRLLTKTAVAHNASWNEVISGPSTGVGQTNTLASIAPLSGNRLGNWFPSAIPSTSARFGDDIVITNVTSFEVKPVWQSATGIASPRVNLGVTTFLPNGDYPFDEVQTTGSIIFDTGMTPAPQIRVTGVQVKIRVYDAKNKMTRQAVVTSKL